jgi:ribosome biogenesis protein ENP2
MQATSSGSRFQDKNATFGQRLAPKTSKFDSRAQGDNDDAMEVSWVPSASSKNHDDDADRPRRKKNEKKRGVERFGAGLEKGYSESSQGISEAERSGRTHRRHGVRSGSKNSFRRM